MGLDSLILEFSSFPLVYDSHHLMTYFYIKKQKLSEQLWFSWLSFNAKNKKNILIKSDNFLINSQIFCALPFNLKKVTSIVKCQSE